MGTVSAFEKLHPANSVFSICNHLVPYALFSSWMWCWSIAFGYQEDQQDLFGCSDWEGRTWPFAFYKYERKHQATGLENRILSLSSHVFQWGNMFGRFTRSLDTRRWSVLNFLIFFPLLLDQWFCTGASSLSFILGIVANAQRHHCSWELEKEAIRFSG